MAPFVGSEDLSPFLAVLGSAIAKHVFSTIVNKPSNQEQELVEVGKVGQLWIYPVKSCHGLTVDSAECTVEGLRQDGVSDRTWIVMNQNGLPVTMGTSTKFAKIKTSLEDGFLLLDAPGMDTLRIPTEEKMEKMEITSAGCPSHKFYVPQAVDCGDQAGSWFDTLLNKVGHRLKFSPKNASKRKTEHILKDWEFFSKPEDQCAFANFCGYMLMSSASLGPLNEKLESPVNCKSFRPSIVVDGCPAFDEDEWDEVVIGNTRFRKVDETSRCFIVNINPETGKVQRNGPKDVLTKMHYRPMPNGKHRPNMGIYLALDSVVGATIRVGDTVFARKFGQRNRVTTLV